MQQLGINYLVHKLVYSLDIEMYFKQDMVHH